MYQKEECSGVALRIRTSGQRAQQHLVGIFAPVHSVVMSKLWEQNGHRTWTLLNSLYRGKVSLEHLVAPESKALKKRMRPYRKGTEANIIELPLATLEQVEQQNKEP